MFDCSMGGMGGFLYKILKLIINCRKIIIIINFYFFGGFSKCVM